MIDTVWTLEVITLKRVEEDLVVFNEVETIGKFENEKDLAVGVVRCDALARWDHRCWITTVSVGSCFQLNIDGCTFVVETMVSWGSCEGLLEMGLQG